jgi:hypothetical protein
MIRWSADMIKDLEFPSNANDQGVVSQENEYNILKRTEQHIFAEVIALNLEISSL